MVIFPASKINLGLSVMEKRQDGFHNVETVLYPIPLCDALEVIQGTGKVVFASSGIPLDNDPADNLVMKAYHLMDGHFGIGPARIHLHKAIPAGAGLGGGSSDAANTLLLINQVFGLGLATDGLEELARELGTDCAFFIQNKPQLALGKGDRFEPVDLSLADHDILLVKAPVHISTAEAYSWITPARKESPLREIIRLPIEDWKDTLVNDFEGPAFQRHPELAEVKRRIQEMGAVYASMTGSGSAIFGIFRKGVLPANSLDFQGCFVWSSERS